VDPVARIKQAARKVERLEQQLDDARRDYWAAVDDAHKAGMSLGEIASELGISRERVRQLIDKRGRLSE
jgi:DNA-directed RNA polymerase sigma subunit (sigma70/sigma32)